MPANDYISWKSYLANDASIIEKVYSHNSMTNWRNCLCGSRGIKFQHVFRSSAAALSNVSYVKSSKSVTSPICEKSTRVPYTKFEQSNGNILEPGTVTKSRKITKAQRKNLAVAVQVVGDGTKLMKTIKMPTVIAKFQNRDLQKSKVYYASLLVDTPEYFGEIPAVLFSSSYHFQRTEYCELLPLVIGKSKHTPDHFTLKPVLKSKKWKRIFSKGCSFKVTALKCGRVFNLSEEYPWNVYDVRIKELRSLLRSIIARDIREIPTEIIETLVSNNEVMRKYKSYEEKERTELTGLSLKHLDEIWMDLEKENY